MSENKSFSKWQDIRIKQLGFANNLILALALGVMGFAIKFIQDENFEPNNIQKSLIWIGGVLTLISILLGILLIINRLEDFRLTANIARKRETGNRKDLIADRESSRKLGKKTWKFFVWQTSTFFIGFLSFLILFLITMKDKII